MSDNADKRTVTTDALETLGTVIGPKEKRDAIHIAVEPVIAKALLKPGQDVAADGSTSGPYVGIVDPFLKECIEPGQRFWLLIYPRQIKSLRHVWSHPAFVDEPHIELLEKVTAVGMSEQWLRDFCERSDCPGYESVMEGILGQLKDVDGYGTSCTIDGEYVHFNGRDAHGEIPPEFWYHYEVVTGKHVSVRPSHFSCSC